MRRRVALILVLISATIVTAMIAAPATQTTRPAEANVVVFGRDATIDHPVHGDVQVYRGSATVSDVIDGDLLVYGDGVTFSGNGRVNGDVILAGGDAHNAEGRIGG